MNRPLVVLCLATLIAISACSSNKTTQTNQSQTEVKESSAKAGSTQAPQPAQPGDLQPGQASGSYTAKGEAVELKYAYAGKATRFGTESMVILLTEKPIPPDALAEEIK